MLYWYTSLGIEVVDNIQRSDSNWFLAIESPTKAMCLLLMSWRKVLGSNLGR
jgi:hypothetical protein